MGVWDYDMGTGADMGVWDYDMGVWDELATGL